MIPADYALWIKIVSPALRSLVPGVTAGVSDCFVEDLPLEDCGDFVWSLVCISRAVPAEMLDRYRTNAEVVQGTQADRLMRGAITEPKFYGFSEHALTRLLYRLGRNLDAAHPGKAHEAHEAALRRIEHIVLYLAEQHPNACSWLAMPEPRLRQEPVPIKRPHTKPRHLRLVGK